MHIEAKTLDDLLRKVYERLLRGGKAIKAGRGAAREQVGAMLILRNPLSRLSRSETRSTLYSCLGETLWYMAGDASIERIRHYVKSYRKMIKANDYLLHAPGAYGPRLFGPGINDQIENIISTLEDPKRRHTRKAVVSIFEKSDLIYNSSEHFDDVPCTISFQFFVRRNKLDMMCNMRSNDAYLGMPHDIFAFTTIQEYIARRIGVQLGRYIHSVGSLHLYDEHENGVKAYLGEGVQDIEIMPEMPSSDAKKGLRWLLDQEVAIRHGSKDLEPTEGVDPYWRDLAKILLLKVLEDAGDDVNFRAVAHSMHSSFFDAFIRDHEARFKETPTDQLSLRLPLKSGDTDE